MVSDIGLEYEDSELMTKFTEFYDDVLPEFRQVGTLKLVETSGG